MRLKNYDLTSLLLQFGDLLFGQRMMARLQFLESAQWWNKEQIETYRATQLQQLVSIAYNQVPFYREVLDAANLLPTDIKTPADLTRLPIITKDLLRKGYPDHVTRPTGQRTYEASTSGSTGKNFYVREDAYTAGWYRASFMLALEWAGWKIGDLHFQTGMTLQRSLDRRLKDWLLNCHYASAYELDDAHLDQMLSLIETKRIKFIFGYPGSLYYLARYARKQGWNQPMRSAVTWGDMLFPHYRQEIEEVFKTRVFDTYGCAEGFHISAQCEYGNYHIHALDVIAEFIDNEGDPVKVGESGNIVITRLHPGPMPFIRYMIGDVGVPTGNESCPCGRGFPLMTEIIGRTSDVVITPSGNRLIIHFFTGILEHFSEIDTFQVVQEDATTLTLRIVPFGNFNEESKQNISESLRRHGCRGMKINFELVDHISLSITGKNRFIISKLP
jgi:phenylacetate-CoA ligase